MLDSIDSTPICPVYLTGHVGQALAGFSLQRASARLWSMAPLCAVGLKPSAG